MMMSSKYGFRKVAIKYEYPVNVLNVMLDQTCTEYPKEEIKWFEQQLDLHMSERIGEVIKAYFSDHMTYEKIGDKYGVTGERIRQVLLKALRKLSSRHKQFYIEKVPFKGRSLSEIGLPVRVSNALILNFWENNVTDPTVDDLLDLTYEDICKIRNLGPRWAEVIIERLDAYGLKLKESDV